MKTFVYKKKGIMLKFDNNNNIIQYIVSQHVGIEKGINNVTFVRGQVNLTWVNILEIDLVQFDQQSIYNFLNGSLDVIFWKNPFITIVSPSITLTFPEIVSRALIGFIIIK